MQRSHSLGILFLDSHFLARWVLNSQVDVIPRTLASRQVVLTSFCLALLGRCLFAADSLLERLVLFALASVLFEDLGKKGRGCNDRSEVDGE